jgi:hypothetical protein
MTLPAKPLVDAAAADIKAAFGKSMTFVSEADTTLGTHPGRVLKYEATEDGIKGTIEARIFVAGTRLFELKALGNDAADVAKFLDSFKIVR